jgi:hypothetical protein
MDDPFAFSNRTKPIKQCKIATSQCAKTDQMNGQTTYRQEGRTDNKVLPKAGLNDFD